MNIICNVCIMYLQVKIITREFFYMTKTVIIGTNHADIAAANTLLDNYSDQ